MTNRDNSDEKLHKLGYSKHSLIGFAVFAAILILGLVMSSKK